MSKRFLGALALLSALCAPASAQVVAPGDRIAAVVGHQVITEYQLQLHIAGARQQAQQAGSQLPPPAQFRSMVLNQMIDQFALAAYAQNEAGIAVDDATVDAAVADVAAGNKLDVAGLRAKLAQDGMGWNDYRAEIRRQILIGRLRQRDASTQVTVSERELDDAFALQQQQRAAEQKLTLAQIFIPVAGKADATQVAAAEARIRRDLDALQHGQDFAALAQQENPPGAAAGGVLGQRSAEQWPSLFSEAVKSLQAGQFSAVVRSPAGFHIIKLLARDQAQAQPDRGMQSHVRSIVLRTTDAASREKAVKELEQIRAAIAAGEIDFAAKARQISQDIEHASQGGDLGWVSPGELPSALDSAIEHLNPGQLSEPIALPGQAVMLQLVDRAERPLSVTQQRALVRSALIQHKQDLAFDDLVADVRARAYVRIPDAD